MSSTTEMPPFSRPPIEPHNLSSAIKSLPDLVDFNARENPNHLFCLQSYKTAEDSHFRIDRVSHLLFKQAILRCARWLGTDVSGLTLPHTGADGTFVKGPPVAILLESSVGLLVHEMALMGLGVPGFGIIAFVLSLGAGLPFCMPPPSMIPTGEAAMELLQAANARSFMSVPSILEELTLLPDSAIDVLKSLNFVAFGGGQLKQDVGERLATAGVRLLNHYGATESGPITPIFFPDLDYDYHYFRLRSDIRLDLRLAPEPTDGDERQHFIITAYPYGWDTPFELQDHLISSPAHPETDFAAVGRKDDMIVLATGEKALPGMLETALAESPAIRAAVAFGEGRFEIGVLVQPATEISHSQVEAFKDRAWTIVQEVNQRMDAHARITSKDSILVVNSTATLPRSDKGSLLRREIYKAFAAEIDGIYQGLEIKSLETLKRPLRWEQLEHDVKSIVQQSVGWNIAEDEWSVEDDLFDLGFDSLQALRLRRVLLASVSILYTDAQSPPAEEVVPRNFVYHNPSVSRMARALKSVNDGGQNSGSEDNLTIAQIVEQYRVLPSSTQATVLVTGATGSLGAHVLAHLVSLENVARVICLDRPKTGVDPSARLQAAVREKDLHIEPHLWKQKVQALQCNTALPTLGLPAETYRNLQGTVTHILHAAWPMDFKRTLISFKSSFQTLQNLLHLAHQAHQARPSVQPRFLFVSSISTVGNFSAVTGEKTIAEAPVPSAACAAGLGYAQAKLACEQMLERTATTELAGEVRVSFARVGQLSGNSRTGFWNPAEHLPALVKTSQEVGALPHLEGTLSWIPVDVAAQTVSDILLRRAAAGTTVSDDLVYHVENPVRQSWHDLLSSLAAKLGLARETALLPYDEWLRVVEERAGPASPARKLLEFFEADFLHMACGNVVLDTYKARRESPALRRLGVVGDEEMGRVLEYWRSVHFIH
ncbi:putative secondary metabolism biosynthetic enzyme [Botryosphaeria dothidea]